MNLITNTWRGLVQRKLWPVALLLVGALVAVPVVLSKQPTAPPASANAAAKTEGVPATFVSAAEEGDAAERRRVLGAAKDPFEPAALEKSKKKSDKQAESENADKSDDTPESKSGGATADTPTTDVPPVSPAPTPTATIPQYSIKVRFGVTDAQDLDTKTVERLSVLPDEETPVLVYRGVEDGGKVAIFELTGDVNAQGDGECLPAPEDCQYLKLRAGETEFITVTETGEETDAQYQLDLVKIYKKATKVAAGADADSESLAKASSASLKGGVALRRRNRYVFDSTTGTLHLARGKKTPAASL